MEVRVAPPVANQVKQALRNVALALVINTLLGIAAPSVQNALYRLRLASLPPPVMLGMPVAGLRAGALRDTWRAPRAGGRRHEGIDLFALRGTPVVATTEGIVAGQYDNRLGGKVVWVLGPGGQRHYYAHLDRHADVAPGQRIQAGTVLGYVGNTGNAHATPPHLHYGIYAARGAINPYPLLLRGTAAQQAALPERPSSPRRTHVEATQAP